MTMEPLKGYRVPENLPPAPRRRARYAVDRHRPSRDEAEALRRLHAGVAEQGSNCDGASAVWVDIDTPEDIPTPEEAEAMCAGCPVFDLCEEYDRLASPPFGLWAGRFRGEEIL